MDKARELLYTIGGALFFARVADEISGGRGIKSISFDPYSPHVTCYEPDKFTKPVRIIGIACGLVFGGYYGRNYALKMIKKI